jgi:integrase/recombinase XerD
MEKLYLKTRSHSLDAPEAPLAEHLGAFEGLLNDQHYKQESIRRHLLLVADFRCGSSARNYRLRK